MLAQTRTLTITSRLRPASVISAARLLSTEAEKKALQEKEKADALAKKKHDSVVNKRKAMQDVNRVAPWFSNGIAFTDMPYEVEDPKELRINTGYTDEAFNAPAIIRRAEANPMQNPTNRLEHWEIVFPDETQWRNPLMGWVSTADPLHVMNRKLRFESLEAAKRHASQYNWKIEVVDPYEDADYEGRKDYAFNFLPAPEVKQLKAKGQSFGKIQYKHLGRKPTFTKFLKYHGDGEVAQHGGEADEAK